MAFSALSKGSGSKEEEKKKVRTSGLGAWPGSKPVGFSGGNTDEVQGGHEECQKDLIFLWQSG